MPARRKSSRFIPASGNFHKDEFPFYWIARLNNLYILRMSDVLGRLGTDVPAWRVLNILKENGTSSVSEIAVHAVARLSTVTKMVYRMKDEGLVSTSVSVQDARVTEVTMTEAGAELLEEMRRVSEGIFQRGFRGMTDAQIQRLNRGLAQIFANLSDD